MTYFPSSDFTLLPLDSNDDRILSLTEFVSFDLPSVILDQAKALFKVIDADCDKYISAEELSDYFNEYLDWFNSFFIVQFNKLFI